MREFSGKTVLITGATGLIGSHIVDTLMQLGDVNVIALSRSRGKLEKGFAEYIGKPTFRYIAQDVVEPLRMNGLMVDYIFHAAGPISGNEIKTAPVGVIMPNLIGVINLLDFLRLQKANTGKAGKMIVFSSATVYSNYSDEDRRVSESDTNAAEPLDAYTAPYSESKRMVEVIARAYQRQYGLDVIIARFGYVYGYTHFPPNTAFYSFINKVLAGENIIMQTPSQQLPRRDNIYIDDVISGLVMAGLRGESGQAYNISSNTELGNFAAIDEIANIMIETVNNQYGEKEKLQPLVVSQGQRKAGLILDNTKLKALDWQPKVGIREGIKRTIEQFYNDKEK